MKSVLISIKPKWCEKICHEIGKDETGKPIYEKRIEVRKSAPKEVPFKAYIYCTKEKKQDDIIWAGAFGDRGKWNGHIIGEFVCDNVEVLFDTNGNPENYMTDILPSILQKTALSYDEFADYVGSRADKNSIYGWHISDLKIYDTPKELSEFYVHKHDTFNYCCGCVYLVRLTTEYPCSECLRDREQRMYLTRPPQSWQYIEEVKE